MKRYFFIVNPASRGGRNRGFLEKLKRWKQQRCPDAEFAVTRHPGHAGELAREAADQGFESVVAVGGDGTLHEALQGIAELPKERRPSLGIISAGTGGDFARFLHEAYGVSKELDWLEAPVELSVDFGRAELAVKGKVDKRYFINIADVGLSGEVTRRVNASSKALGTLEYLRATLGAAMQFRPPRVQVKLTAPRELVQSWEVDLFLLVVANGRYFGGGMCIAPKAEITDQRFQILLAEKINYLTLLMELPKLYLKKELRHPKIHYTQGSALEVSSLDGPLSVGMDGEFFQADQVHFEMIPQGVKILVPNLKPPTIKNP